MPVEIPMNSAIALTKFSELHRKIAASQNDFEQGFFQLAYDKLQNKLFNLIPKLVGFELVRKSDDGSKAIGVFGFKSDNGQVLYVPSFFINGKVKDLDIMYSKNNNQFYPLNEDFAELFLKDDVTGMGAVSNEKRKDIEKSIPPVNYRDMIVPPRTGKISYASVLDYVEASDNNVKQAFVSIMEKNAEYTEALRGYYSDEKIAKALIPHKVYNHPRKLAELDVVKFAEADWVEGLTQEDKIKIASTGYTLIDKRAEDKKTRFGNFQYTQKFTNPNESGFYSYITELGTLRYGFILLHPAYLHQGFSTPSTIVIDLESKKQGQAYIVPQTEVFIREQIKVADYSAIHKLMEEPSEALPSFSDTFILINENFHCTKPFRLVENFKDASGLRRLQVEPDYCNDCDNRKFDAPGNRFEQDKEPTRIVLVFTKKSGNSLEYKTGVTYVPKGYKLLKIHTSVHIPCVYDPFTTESARKKKNQAQDEEQARTRQGKPGKLHHLTALLGEQGIFPGSVRTNGSEYFLTIGAAKKEYPNAIEAKIGMVIDVGLSEKNAQEFIDQLIKDTPVEGHFKFAYTGDYTMMPQDEAPWSNELGQPTYSGVPWQNTVPTSDSYTGDPTRKGLGVSDPNSGQGNTDSQVQDAVGMAQNGQKEIFDTQSISTIAKYVDPSSKIIEYIPAFTDSLDKLGRMLFMILWSTDKFEEFYGKDSLPELIELIKNVFKNLGDLVIFIKRKVPDVSINNNEQENDSI